jgi:hypothetical protein
MEYRGWKRLWIPSYFCQDVVSSIYSTGIGVKVYPDRPDTHKIQLNVINEIVPGDVFFRVNFFGLRDGQSMDRSGVKGMEIIDDHTHDPWSDWAWGTDADWCIASLRKALPVPDGGVVWSPVGHELPPKKNLSYRHYVASLEKYASMFMKTMYLESRFLDKEIFRRLSVSGEQNISVSGEEVSGISEWTLKIMESFPVMKWRERRNFNHKVFLSSLDDVNWMTVLKAVEGSGCCPFSGVIIFDSSSRRTYIKDRLMENDIYPAILWPLDNAVVQEIPEEHKDLSRKMLSIHCDMRYEDSDIKRVARLIRKYGNEFESIRHE